MTRAVSVGRSSRKGLLFTLGALGSVFVTMTLSGCPGTLQGDFPSAGNAGSSGGTAGAGTAGMAMGTAGSTGAAGSGLPAGCDPVTMLTTSTGKYNCTVANICHDASGSAANFNMTQANWSNLVGVVPKGGGTIASICAKDPNYKAIPYIIKGSPTGDGLIMKKLMAPVCSPNGTQMPTLPGPITVTADMACIQAWATQLANAK
jgi:hypothetical protein